MYNRLFKRFFDILFSSIGFLILSPVFLLTTICLGIANRGKPFFIQQRPGKNGKIFHILKFKTMNDQRDSSGALLPDNKRLTPVGAFIRKTSLDEIPQLINVIKGDMSLIGPRPLLVDYLPLYSPEQARRHEVRPGITGWAQINGRNAISWEEKFKLDVWYVDHLSFQIDVKILLLSVKKVLAQADINSGDTQTMEPFIGTKEHS
ncbi:MAG: sugar transferase [Rikenellaceae bacterium]|nr:sugar transferase [Rikenellaceae bacterium]